MKKYLNKITLVIILMIILSSCTLQKTNTKLEQNPEKAEQKFIYLFSEANKNRLLGNTEKAIELYTSAIDIKTSSSASNYYLSGIFFTEEKYNSALIFAENAIKINPENIWYNILKGDILTKQNKTTEALNIYKKQQEKFPDNELIYNKIIDILIQRINFSKSKNTQISSETKNDYLKLIEIYSIKQKHFGYDTQISLNLYRLYKETGNTKRANETLKTIIKNEPEEPKYQAMLAELYFSQNEREKAEKIYNRLIKNFSDDSSVKLSYAIFCKVTGKKEKYFNLVKDLLKSEIELNIKINLLISGQYPNFPKQEYEDLLKELHKNHPETLTVNILLSEYYIEENKAKATKYLKKAIELSNSDFNLILTYFEILYDTKDFKTLYKESKKYIEQYPNRPKFFLYNGLSAYEISKYDEAIFILESGKELVIENNNLLVQFHYYLAESFHKKKQNQKSDEHFEAALKLNPKFHLAQNNYSYYLSERNDKIEKALKLAENNINYQNNNPVFCNTYAKALFRNKQFEKALIFSEKAIKTISDNPEFLENIGDIYFALENKEKAKEFWEKSKQKGNTTEKLTYKIENINTLTTEEI